MTPRLLCQRRISQILSHIFKDDRTLWSLATRTHLIVSCRRSSHSHQRIPGAEQSNLPAQIDLLEKYRALVTLGHISYDEEQIRVVMKLRRLQRELADYAPPALAARLLETRNVHGQENGWWMFSEDETELDNNGKALVTVRGQAEELSALDTPKGLLLTGPPGSGKSFLVDLWFESVSTPYKARKHYNQLVLEIYRGVWEETQRRMNSIYAAPKPNEDARGPWNGVIRKQFQNLVKVGSLPIRWARANSLSFTETAEPSIAFIVAKRLLLHHWLLVFDEIQLLDVSSANLLADVLSWYWRMGGVIVGTSNKVPDELYRNGVQRERLEPFVEALKARCPVTILDVEKDWREVLSVPGPLERTWFTLDQECKFEHLLQQLSPVDSEPKSLELHVFGRSIRVPWISGSISKFSFSELCDQSLGPADYLTIASTFPIIAITNIPVLPLSSKDQARRLISLIDALYESRCKIICLAETTPDKLFFPDALVARRAEQLDMIMAETVAETQDVYRPNVSSYDTPSMREAPAPPKAPLSLDALSIFSGEEEQFAFKRALSRLVEMTSAAYNRIDKWSPLPANARKWERTSTSPPTNPVASHLRGTDGETYITLHHGSGSFSSSWQSKQATRQPSDGVPSEDEDFASEASYETANPYCKRPSAPRLSPNHVWVVREDWGESAKDWGKGAKIHAPSSESTKDTDSKSQPT